MRPPPVYPQLWPYHFIWKEIFEEVNFLHKIIKTPMKHRKKKKKRERIKKEKKKKSGRKRKALRVSSNKKEVNILRG
jgi:hypothetical protein